MQMLPKPPTDSLYKFLSVIGLSIFLASVIAPILLSKQLNNQAAEYIRDLRALNMDTEKWKETGKRTDSLANRLREQSAKLEEASNPKSKLSQKERQQIFSRIEGLLQEQEQTLNLHMQQLRDWSKQDIEVDYKKDLFEDSKVYVARMVGICVIGAIVGLGMSVIGFVLWYKRAQKFEDLVLKRKVEEKSESRIIIP
jgi:hypothetical protein